MNMLTKGKASNDPDFNRLIEQRAVREAVAYYRKQGFVVEDVQKENCGWDLTVSRDDTAFFVEVKGNAADIPHLRLTPNEYRTLQKRYKQYRIISVTGCRNGGTPRLREYTIGRRRNDEGTFFLKDGQGRQFALVEIVSAVIAPKN